MIDLTNKTGQINRQSNLKRAVNIYNHFEEYVLISSLVVTVVLIFYQVVMRYVFNNSPSWTEEIARYLFIWMSWLGTSLGVRDNKHIRVELIENAFVKRGKLKQKNVLFIFILVIWTSLTVVLSVSGFQFVVEMIARGALSPAVRIPMAYVALSVPVGCLAVSIRLIYLNYLEFNKLLKGGVA